MRRLAPVMALLLLVGVTACGEGGETTETSAAPPTSIEPESATTTEAPSETTTTAEPAVDEVQALVEAAEAEGTVTIYSAADDATNNQIVEGFEAAYDIDVEMLRLAAAELQTRFLSESEAGSSPADLIGLSGGGALPFAEEAMSSGWVIPITEAGIPVLDSGDYDEAYLRGPLALYRTSPWVFVYNTDQVTEVPETWADLADGRFSEQILLPDPTASDSYFQILGVILDDIGEEAFRTVFQDNVYNVYASGAPAIEALGAGEGSILVPTTGGLAQGAIERGAPVAWITPDVTTGSEQLVVMPNLEQVEHPNAARLLAHWMMSEEGNRFIAELPGAISIYDSEGFPSGYVEPDADAANERRDEILGLLGLE